MDAKTTTGPVQCLLSRMVEIFSTADHSPTASDFRQEIEKANAVARELEQLTGPQCLSCQAEIQNLLETTKRLTCDDHRPDDQELIGLTEWADHIHGICVEREARGACPLEFKQSLQIPSMK